MPIIHLISFKKIKLATSLLFIIVAIVGEFRKPKKITPRWPR